MDAFDGNAHKFENKLQFILECACFLLCWFFFLLWFFYFLTVRCMGRSIFMSITFQAKIKTCALHVVSIKCACCCLVSSRLRCYTLEASSLYKLFFKWYVFTIQDSIARTHSTLIFFVAVAASRPVIRWIAPIHKRVFIETLKQACHSASMAAASI